MSRVPERIFAGAGESTEVVLVAPTRAHTRSSRPGRADTEARHREARRVGPSSRPSHPAPGIVSTKSGARASQRAAIVLEEEGGELGSFGPDVCA